MHSGDSACVIPSISLGEGTLEQVRKQTKQLALGLGVRGLMNVQFAYQNYQLYVLEVNPRGSRTVPFVSKATGVPMAQLATRVILGERLADLGAGAPRARARQRQGGRAALRPLPGLRHAARPGDEVDRRGDGHRRRLPGGLRQGPGRRRRAAAARGQRLPLGLRQRQVGGDDPGGSGSTSSASRSTPRGARPRRSRAWASPSAS